jgi:hypothetical protein
VPVAEEETTVAVKVTVLAVVGAAGLAVSVVVVAVSAAATVSETAGDVLAASLVSPP